MGRFERALSRGPLGRLLRARYYVPMMSLVIVVLLGVVGAELLARAGAWPPLGPRAHPSVLITGPGTGDPGTRTIQAYVLGAVRAPGVYALAEGGRVRDLVAAAGGLLSDADLTRVDFAAPVADGQELYVPRVGEQVPVTLGGKLNINRASAEEMHNALGLSLTIARRVVAYRVAHGPFTAVSQLLLVPMSRTTYDHIKDLITI
ncbi:MAG: ComEA family DNA-binding protein [Ktedonobacterales bacterium]|nr:ComEA family DNA-binding protein [Ktedonobacterales bacterium]